MLLAYTYNHKIKPDKPFLAIIPDRGLDKEAEPVPVDKLAISDAAVFYISNQEAVSVKTENGGLVIKPLAGQQLYITTNLSDRPGISAKEIKIEKSQAKGNYTSFYKKEKDTTWNAWTPQSLQI
ncbi:MAG: hypothetical protein ACOX3T_04785 [Bdellovibrionota bacterium]